MDRVFHEEPRARAAALPLIEVDADMGPYGGRRQIGIGEHDVGALAAEFKGQPFELVGCLPHDDLRRFARAREGHFVDAGVLHDRGAGGGAEAGHHIDHAIGDARLLREPRQPQAGQRCLLGRFHHDRAAGSQGRAPFPGHHQDREIPGDDLPRHADRLASGVAEVVAVDGDRLAMDLVGPTGVVAQGVECQRDIDMPGVGKRLAVVERFERRQFVDLRFDEVGQLQHQPATLAGIHPGPRPGFKSLPRRRHGRIHIGGIPFGHLGDRLLGGGIDRVERAAAAGRPPLAADEELGLANLRGRGSPAIAGLRLGRRRGDGVRFRLCHSRFSLRLSFGERVRTVVNSPFAVREAAFRNRVPDRLSGDEKLPLEW